MNKLVTIKMVNEWIYLYQQKKLTYREISVYYGFTPCTIRYHLKNNGIKSNPKNQKQYYKDKFQIFIYDYETEELKWVFNNPNDMAKTLNKSINVIFSKLNSRSFNTKFRIKGKWYIIKLIEVEDE